MYMLSPIWKEMNTMTSRRQTFKEFFLKRMIQESPTNTGVFDTPYSDIGEAQEIYTIIKNDPENYEIVYSIFNEHKVDLVLNREGDDATLYFVPRNDKFIYGYATYGYRQDGGIEMVSVYNRPLYFGLAQHVYLEYLIPHHKYVLSNGFHSKSGKSFWYKVVIFGLGKGMNVTIWDDKIGKDVHIVNSGKDLEKYYGDDMDYERYRIKIWK